jgi:hypothetical protein
MWEPVSDKPVFRALGNSASAKPTDQRLRENFRSIQSRLISSMSGPGAAGSRFKNPVEAPLKMTTWSSMRMSRSSKLVGEQFGQNGNTKIYFLPNNCLPNKAIASKPMGSSIHQGEPVNSLRTKFPWAGLPHTTQASGRLAPRNTTNFSS